MSGRFGRRFNYRSRVRYARGRYNGRRVGFARRARGNARAANQQNDISNVTINLMKKVKSGVTGFKVRVNGSDVLYEIGTCALNIFELLKKSEFYKSYSNMYDQFRINRVQVKVTPVTWQTYNQFNLPNIGARVTSGSGDDNIVTESDGNALYPGNVDGDNDYIGDYQGPTFNYNDPTKKYIVPQALTIVTAWDRTGLDDTQMLSITKEGTDYVVTTIGDKITTYSSAKSTQLVAGANFNCVRYLYPSSSQEKSLYFSTSELVDQIADPTTGQKWYYLKKGENFNSSNITNLHSDPNCPFKPTFLIGVLKVEDLIAQAQQDLTTVDPDNTLGQIAPVTFNLEFDIGVTFRGLRKTQVV